jgi:thioredoxin 1
MNRNATWLMVALLSLFVIGCTSQHGPDASSGTHAGPDGNHATVAVDDTNFNVIVLQSDKPVLVDFWAEWCGPCQVLTPIVEELATDFEGRAVVAKVDVDQSPFVAQQYGIASIPAIILFKDGKMVDRVIGIHSKEDLSAMLESAL